MTADTEPPPSAEPTPTRGPWTVVRDMCLRTGGRCYATARAGLRVRQSPDRQEHALRCAMLGRRMMVVVERLEGWIAHAPSEAEFVATCDEAMCLQEDARETLLLVGVTL